MKELKKNSNRRSDRYIYRYMARVPKSKYEVGWACATKVLPRRIPDTEVSREAEINR